MVRISLVHETTGEGSNGLPRIDFSMPKESIANLFEIVAVI